MQKFGLSDGFHRFKSPLAVISGGADLPQKSSALTDRDKKARQMQPFIKAKVEEIYEICEKGHPLL